MRLILSITAVLLLGLAPQIRANEFNPEQFVTDYFEAWTATQKPDATEKELEHYLSFLADDVGHQHLPYDTDDTRNPDGKESIREGMTHYLGKHIEYSAELINFTFGLDVVAIQFAVSAKGRRGPDQPIVEMNYDTLEVLEIEDGKVSVIRKYN